MTGELQVEVERLRTAAAFASEKAQTIRAQLTQLDTTVGKELLVDGWRGKAASAYDESWLEWKAGADTIIAALEDSAAGLAAAAAEYERQEAANTAAITQAGEQV